MPLDELLDGFAAEDDIPALSVHGLNLDSRCVTVGDVYLAVQGTVSHGLEFAQAAEKAGASATLIDATDVSAEDARLTALAKPVIRVTNLAMVAGPLASRFFGHPTRQLEVCGVTGTDGKTSVCRFISEALCQQGQVTGYIGTIGWGIGEELEPNPLTTPDPVTLQRMFKSLRERGATAVALEVSSHALAQGRVNGVAFDVAVLTNFGRDHLDYHGSVANYSAAKELLFAWPNLRGVVLNVDDPLGQKLYLQMGEKDPKPTVLGFSTNSQVDQESDVVASDIVADENGLAFTLSANAFHTETRSPLLGRFNVQNLLASFGALTLLGVAANDAIAQLTAVRSVPGRMEHFTAQGAANAVVDYAHTPQALEAAIRTLRLHCRGRLIVVFGCGGDRDTGKRQLMGEVAAEFADAIIVTDDNPRTENSQDIINQVMTGVPSASNVKVINDRSLAITTALQEASPEDWVLVAGKGHEDYQIIGTTVHPFSDRSLVADVLAQRSLPLESSEADV